MEGDRRVQVLVAVIAAVLLAFSYGVGYYVGKSSGIEEEKKICEVEKRQLIKTLSSMTPVSRPEPVEEKVVGAPAQSSPVKSLPETLQKSDKQVKSSETESAPEKRVTPEGQKAAAKPESKVPVVQQVVKSEKASPKKPSLVKSAQTVSAEKREKTVYYLQVGVFRSKANAVKLAQELMKKGFQAKTLFERGYAKVVVGNFDSLHQAKVVQRELRSAGFNSILRWRKE